MRTLLAGLLVVTRFWLSSAQEIASLTLINSSTNEPVVELTDGAVIDIRALGFEEPSFNIEALTSSASVGSVRFDFDDIANYRTENKAPWSMCGDQSGLFYYCAALNEGTHTISATAFSGSGASGTFGATLNISFTLMLGPPVPVASPVEAPGPTETPAASPITETPAASPITETPAASPITESPAASRVTETPVASPVTEAPTAGAVSNSDSITVLYLIYSPTNERITELYDGAIVSLTDLNLTEASFNVEAVATDDVMSVFFQESSRIENKKPFSFCGDKGGDFATCVVEFFVGSINTLTVTPYTGLGQSGTALPVVSVSFSIQSETAMTNSTKMPSEHPSRSPSAVPSDALSDSPIAVPSNGPTTSPSDVTTEVPGPAPTSKPSTGAPFDELRLDPAMLLPIFPAPHFLFTKSCFFA